MKKILIVILFLIAFLFIFFRYLQLGHSMGIAYYDEVDWVAKSYYFDFFIRQDFDNQIWQTQDSYDQPNLAKFYYGAWMYPLYLKEKRNQKELDYIKYLINKGFYHVDEKYLSNYSSYANKVLGRKSSILQPGDSGQPDYYVSKYGNKAIESILLIYHARLLNYFVLAVAVLIAGYIVFLKRNFFISIIFTFIYGLNSLLISAGLRVHADALFLLFFNLSLLFLLKYFLEKQRFKYLLLFSLSVGLLSSTKINGPLFTIIFIVLLVVYYLFKTKDKKRKKIVKLLSHFSFHVAVLTIIVIFLNPFLYIRPIKNIKNMYQHRIEVAKGQAKFYNEDYLKNAKERVNRIFYNFYNFKIANNYNNYFLISSGNKSISLLLFSLFILGLTTESRRILKKNFYSITIFLSFVTIVIVMCFYLILDWARYYIHIVFFFYYYQTIGLVWLYRLLKKSA